jgi:hypothetical protein
MVGGGGDTHEYRPYNHVLKVSIAPASFAFYPLLRAKAGYYAFGLGRLKMKGKKNSAGLKQLLDIATLDSAVVCG